MPSSPLSQLLDAIAAARPKHSDYIREAESRLDSAEKEELERYLDFRQRHGEDTASLCHAYCSLLDQTLEEQLYFQRNGTYRFSSFSEVADRVYFDESFMHDYMVGLAISQYLWPNHLEIKRFFRSRLPREIPGSYLEVGPGHGEFLLAAMRDTGYTHFTGVDLSPASIRLTGDVVQSELPGEFPRLELILGDFLNSALPASRYDAIVMGEVLEHVEQPLLFLQRIADLIEPEGFVFITTCINAPEIDHIYLFSEEREIRELIAEAGLEIVAGLTVPHHGMSLEKCVKLKLPINVAYQLGAPTGSQAG